MRHAVQEAQAKWFEFERDVDFLFIGVIAESADRFRGPIPLGIRRDDFALPDVFAENEQDILGVPGAGEIDELFACVRYETRARAR